MPILRENIIDESVDLVYLDPPFNSNRSYNVLFQDESGMAAEAQITAFDDTGHVGTWDCRGMNGGGTDSPMAMIRRRHSCPYGMHTMKHRPNTMRHVAHDYTAPGAYFVTICVHDRQMLFGQIVDGVMQLNPLGGLAQRCLVEVMRHNPNVRLDVFVVMPNHVHILLWIVDQTGEPPAAGPQRQFAQPIAGSLSTLIGTYKAEVSRQARRAGLAPAGPLWQRNFWDRIVRDDRELHNVRNYIQTNPQRWDVDRLR